MKYNFKFNASRVDEIEKIKGLPIENCIGDDTINNLALFIQKGLVDDNGNVGVSKNVAFTKIDEYLEEHDKNDLLLDITEALVEAGFLSRSLDITKMREISKKRADEVQKMIDEQ